MHYTIRLSINVPTETIDAFTAAGWEMVAPKDSPVVSGALVDTKLVWPGPGEPAVPQGHSLTGPDSEGFCTVDGIADTTI